MPAFLGLQPLESDLYQATFDIVLTSVNLFVIDDPQDGLIVIDTSAPGEAGDENAVARAVRQLGRAPGDVRHILLTHAHPDHIGNAGEVQRQSGADIWMNPAGAALLESSPMTLRPVNIRGGGVRVPNSDITPATVQHRVVGGEVVPLAGGIEVIDTPGHAQDHQSFLWQRHGGVLFIGDAVANEHGQMNFAPFYDDLDEERRSVEKLAGYRFEKIAFGHGECVSHGGRERLARWLLDDSARARPATQ